MKPHWTMVKDKKSRAVIDILGNLFPPLDNLELIIRRRTGVDPNLLNNFNMTTNGNGDDVPRAGGDDLPVLDLRTMEELCQPTLNGQGGLIAPIAIQTMNFGLKNDMIQQVQNSCQFHRLPGDDANKHLDKFLHVTQSIKVNEVTNDAIYLYLFPHSLTHHATTWFDRLPRNSITTFEKMAKMFLEKYFPPSMVTKLRNEITNFRQRLDKSLFKACEHYKILIDRRPNHNMLPVTQIDTFYNGLTLIHRDTINAAASRTFMKSRPEECYDLIKNMTLTTMIGILPLKRGNNQKRNQFFQGASHGQKQPPAYQARAYQASGYQALVQQAPIPQLQVVTTTEFINYMKANDAILKNMQMNMTSLTNSNLELKNLFGQFMKMNTASSSGSVIKDTMPPTNNGSTKDVHPPVVQVETKIQNSEPVVALIVEPVEAPTGRALIDVYEGELNLRVGNKAVTFNLNQTLRYTANYDAESINRIDVIGVACEEYSQEVLGFSVSGNPTPSTELLVSTSSPTLTSFGDSDFLLKETDAFLAIEDEPISLEIDDSYYDSKGDILLLE
nr:reverse transcriptase domain-containing protein [Tanacetum cinerariifolium]